MTRFLLRRIFLCLTAFICAGFLNFPNAAASPRLKVATTIFPLADMVQNVGKNKIQVISILPTGSNPHTFALTPKQVRELSGAKIVFSIGHHLDSWISVISDSLPEANLVPLSEGIVLLEGQDPHYWLSIKNAKIMVENIVRTLSMVDPANAGFYEINAKSYLKQLDETDQKIKKIFEPVSQKKIITFHNGWGYFTQDYHLSVIGNVESKEGSEPTPKTLAALGNLIRENQIHVLFIEPWIPSVESKPFVEDFKLQLYVLDPLGGISDRSSYIDLMLYNANTISKALGSSHE